jgi:sarcosine oxidase, subunit gamma
MIPKENASMANPYWQQKAEGVEVHLEAPSRHLILRLHTAHAQGLDRLATVLGARLPVAPNTISYGVVACRWLSPNIWVFVGDGLPSAKISAACGDDLHHISDVTDGCDTFRVFGPKAKDLLAKATSLDIHPSILAHGHCAQTRFAQTHAHIVPQAALHTFNITIDASYTGHLKRWFEDALIEFQLSSTHSPKALRT